MEIDFILGIIEKSGYLGLFFWLWIGVIGAPVPNEVLGMLVGAAASRGVLQPVVTFFTVYLGILAAITTAYVGGRLIGSRLLLVLQKRKRFRKTINKSLKFIEKYHKYSLLFSYFFPGLRNFVPFLYGISGLSYKSFALFAYTGALTWLTIIFNVGFWLRDNKVKITGLEPEFFIIIGVATVCFVVIILIKRKHTHKKRLQALK